MNYYYYTPAYACVHMCVIYVEWWNGKGELLNYYIINSRKKCKKRTTIENEKFNINTTECYLFLL